MLSQQIEAPGSPSALNATQYYRYDALNRLGIVAEGVQPSGPDTCPTTAGTWCRDFSYDPYGNRAVTGSFNGGLSLATPTATSAYTATTNRLTSSWANYDAAGNITAFVKSGYEWSAFYDAENKQAEYCPNTQTACGPSVAATAKTVYAYDGQGNRVKKVVNNAGTTVYVYDAFGKLASEYSNLGQLGPKGTLYRTADHLGSTRIVTDAGGNIALRRDFFPFAIDSVSRRVRSSNSVSWGAILSSRSCPRIQL
ncbi:MAG TPA: hypothetical protein VML01_00630 [Bryobacterales bacterium]|nr:hypothetical protein [Bryobacterales bacterium]